jgi:hypothetical protein
VSSPQLAALQQLVRQLEALPCWRTGEAGPAAIVPMMATDVILAMERGSSVEEQREALAKLSGAIRALSSRLGKQHEAMLLASQVVRLASTMIASAPEETGITTGMTPRRPVPVAPPPIRPRPTRPPPVQSPPPIPSPPIPALPAVSDADLKKWLQDESGAYDMKIGCTCLPVLLLFLVGVGVGIYWWITSGWLWGLGTIGVSFVGMIILFIPIGLFLIEEPRLARRLERRGLERGYTIDDILYGVEQYWEPGTTKENLIKALKELRGP